MEKQFKESGMMQELLMGALNQGYGDNLDPLFKNPVLNLGTYLKLRGIEKTEKSPKEMNKNGADKKKSKKREH